MHLADEWLQWFLEGHSSETLPKEVSTHLAACETCRRRVCQGHPPVANDVTGPSPSDHRREPRVTVDEAASIELLSPLAAEALNIRILDISRNGLKVWTPIFLERGVVLQIRLREMSIMGEVRHCTPVEGGFHAGLYIEDCVERRKFPRTRIQIRASILSMPNSAEPQRDYHAKILNQSGKGMLVAVEQRIPLGAAVRILSEGKLYLAEVVYCHAVEDGFRIGIQIDQALTL